MAHEHSVLSLAMFNSCVNVYQRVADDYSQQLMVLLLVNSKFFLLLPKGYISLNPIQPPFSYGFPMVFLWFSYRFPVFLWFSHGFPMVFPWSHRTTTTGTEADNGRGTIFRQLHGRGGFVLHPRLGLVLQRETDGRLMWCFS